MKIRVYFCKEPDIQPVILKNNKISRQALSTVYDFVWESEFRIWSTWVRFGLNLLKRKKIRSEYH